MPLGDSGGVVQRIHLHTDHYSACETLTYLPVIAKLYWVSSQMCSQMRGHSVQRNDSGIHHMRRVLGVRREKRAKTLSLYGIGYPGIMA